MTRYKILLLAAMTVLATAAILGIRAQPMDEGSQATAEDMMVDDAVSGAIEEPAGGAAEAAQEAILEAPEMEVMMEGEVEEPVAIIDEQPAEAAPAGRTLEDEVSEILGEGGGSGVAVEEPAAAVEEFAPAEEAMSTVEEFVPAEESTSAAEEALKEAAAEMEEGATAVQAMPRLEKETAAGQPPEVVILREGEELRRKAFEGYAVEKIAQAEVAMAEKKFTDARKLFKTALEAFAEAGNRPQTRPARDRCKQGDMEAAYGQALLLVKDHDLAEAERQAKQALYLGHPEAAKLLEKIQEAMKEKPKPPPKPAVRWKQEDYKAAQKTVEDLLRQGREHFMAGEYDKAQVSFERVLKDHPHNTEAIRWREKVAQQKYGISSSEVQSTREDMMTQVRKAWNRRDYGLDEMAEEMEAQKQNKGRIPVDLSRQKVIEKMQNIVIPEVDFRQANINDVVTFLQAASVEFDISTEAKRGVNLILNLLRPGAGWGGGGLMEDGATGNLEVPQVTFKARDISLLDVLKTVTEVAGLKYRIEGSVVMVLPIDAPGGPILRRTYDVMPTVAERIGTLFSEVGARGGDEGFRELGATSIESDRTDWKELFKEMGVEWPVGSSIKYLQSLGKIMVANTADNLAVFEERLNELNVIPNQIEIEARFVEVKQTDLSSLGFEYLLTDDWELAQTKNSAGLPFGQRERIVMRANNMGTTLAGSSAAGPSSSSSAGGATVTTRGGFTSGARFLSDAGQTITGAALVNDKLLTLATVLTNPELTFVLHALQQKGNADLLSAPKVVTQSGLEATIKVVVEYIYPTEFNITPIQSQTINGGTVPVGGIVEPSSFETREVGVILTVLPTVSTEGQMINLTLAPEVVTEPEWRDYGSQFTLPDGTTIQMPMPQPFFPSRSINTSILIYNGATVVMGGMINEARTSVDDKVPFLGDIPIVGRLFQSKSDRSEKRNLLIFVTARLVDPAGRQIGPPKVLTQTLATTPPPMTGTF